MRDELQIRYKNDVLRGELYVTALELTNAGKASIKTSDFDSNRAIKFRLDARIVKHLSTEHSPKTAPTPRITVSGNQFFVAPELIVKGEVVKFSLLTEHRPTKIETAFSPFSEVRLETGDRENLAAKRTRSTRVARFAALTCAAVIITAEGVLLQKLHNQAATAESIASVYRDCTALWESKAFVVEITTNLKVPTTGLPGPYLGRLDDAANSLASLVLEYASYSHNGLPMGNDMNTAFLAQKTIDAIHKDVASESKQNANSVNHLVASVRQAINSQSSSPTSCRMEWTAVDPDLIFTARTYGTRPPYGPVLDHAAEAEGLPLTQGN